MYKGQCRETEVNQSDIPGSCSHGDYSIMGDIVIKKVNT